MIWNTLLYILILNMKQLIMGRINEAHCNPLTVGITLNNGPNAKKAINYEFMKKMGGGGNVFYINHMPTNYINMDVIGSEKCSSVRL